MAKKASIKEIRTWYRLCLKCEIWFSKEKAKACMYRLPDEAWYGGPWFYSGLFIFLPLGLFSTHIILRWWDMDISKGGANG